MGAKSQTISPPFGHKAGLPPSKKYLIVRQTLLNFVILVSSDRYGNLVIKWMILIIFQFEAVSCKLVEIFYFWINP